MDSDRAKIFSENCNNLLKKYKKLQQLDYMAFLNVWSEVNFDQIYSNDSDDGSDNSDSENNKDFNEVTMKREVFYYLLKGTERFGKATNLYEQVGAFYLLHRLFYRQTFHTKVKIRLKLDNYKILKELVKKMKIIQQLDFLYIFAKMTVDEAFHYVFVDKKMKLFSMDTWSSETTENTLENVLDKLLCDSEIMANLTKTQDTYSKGLEEYLGENPQYTFTVNKMDVVTQLQEANTNN